jgi:hypothetical protein
MKYEIRYYQDRSSYYVLCATCETIAEARELRAVAGDLVVEAATDRVVADPSWLWVWEKTSPGAYARNNLGRHRPGVELGRYGILLQESP